MRRFIPLNRRMSDGWRFLRATPVEDIAMLRLRRTTPEILFDLRRRMQYPASINQQRFELRCGSCLSGGEERSGG